MTEQETISGKIPAREYPPSRLWTIRHLAEHASVSVDTIERLIADGELDAVKMRGVRRVTHESYLRYIKSQIDQSADSSGL